jgi:hypothetical protein
LVHQSDVGNGRDHIIGVAHEELGCDPAVRIQEDKNANHRIVRNAVADVVVHLTQIAPGDLAHLAKSMECDMDVGLIPVF